MLGIPRRFGHFVFGAIQSGLTYLTDRRGHCEPAGDCGNRLPQALARVLADLPCSDAAGRPPDCACDQILLAAADVRTSAIAGQRTKKAPLGENRAGQKVIGG
jgi:hypothetical protein